MRPHLNLPHTCVPVEPVESALAEDDDPEVTRIRQLVKLHDDDEAIDLEPFKWKGSKRYRGVNISGRKYISQIQINGQKVYLGSHNTAEAAARAFAKAFIAHHGAPPEVEP